MICSLCHTLNQETQTHCLECQALLVATPKSTTKPVQLPQIETQPINNPANLIAGEPLGLATLEYDVTALDFIWVNIWYALRFAIWVGLLAACSFLLVDQTLSVGGLITAALATILVYLAVIVVGLPFALLYHSISSRGIITRHLLIFYNDYFVEKTMVNRDKFLYNSIFKVARRKRYLHIFVSRFRAHSIPMRVFKGQEHTLKIIQTCLAQFSK